MSVIKPHWQELRAKHIRAKKGRKVVGIILHDTAGGGKHNDTLYLANPGDGRKVSADFTVERDGSIWKLNPDLDNYYTLHAGRATAFKGLSNGGVTAGTIGIEITQSAALPGGASPYPDAQVIAVAQLCAYLADRYKLKSADISTHRNIITDGSRSDPRRFPFEGVNGFWHYFWAHKSGTKAAEAYRASEEIKTDPEGARTPEIMQGAAIDTDIEGGAFPTPGMPQEPIDGAQAPEEGTQATGATTMQAQPPPTPPTPNTEVVPTSFNGRITAIVGFILANVTAFLGKLAALPTPILVALIIGIGVVVSFIFLSLILLKNKREERAHAKDIALIEASKK